MSNEGRVSSAVTENTYAALLLNNPSLSCVLLHTSADGFPSFAALLVEKNCVAALMRSLDVSLDSWMQLKRKYVFKPCIGGACVLKNG
jgi:hypothetical protein